MAAYAPEPGGFDNSIGALLAHQLSAGILRSRFSLSPRSTEKCVGLHPPHARHPPTTRRSPQFRPSYHRPSNPSLNSTLTRPARRTSSSAASS